MNYRKRCPICNEKLEIDDIDYNFEGCQDEMLICPHCNITFEFRVRYGKVCRKYKYVYHNEEEWKEGCLND